MFGVAFNFGLFGDSPAQTVVLMYGCIGLIIVSNSTMKQIRRFFPIEIVVCTFGSSVEVDY
ncbi:hypothetical protein ALQ98_200004 [Pseudomonas syringae pv. lapsa]|uniref:Uncharacterized protein n=1 Tax=Pseudomonas syringae pv. lapsa TaxID=199201 RepID=A0AB74A421_PSESX|nr:hypothetical protein ALQ98_200004 [Pseudomonas syringae pv. lapsa]